MLATTLLQESGTAKDFSWLVWVALAIFAVMVLLGWWASGRLPKEDETVHPHAGEAGTDAGAAKKHEEQVSQEHEDPATPQ